MHDPPVHQEEVRALPRARFRQRLAGGRGRGRSFKSAGQEAGLDFKAGEEPARGIVHRHVAVERL